MQEMKPNSFIRLTPVQTYTGSNQDPILSIGKIQFNSWQEFKNYSTHSDKKDKDITKLYHQCSGAQYLLCFNKFCTRELHCNFVFQELH